ncbi:hypothetical protein [Nocardia abscessus]|uniref:hypothetical protein n=1 Tax=Nocardia abscessus TaxID=120957 RepID=UPI001E2BE1A1|nr:hypothetical protein [Nocardia abscessus]
MTDANGRSTPVTVDWYLCAMPVEKAVTLLSDEILDADPHLAGMRQLRTDSDLETMEGANESGRAAANAILDAADDPAPRVPVYPLVSLPIFEPWKRIDAGRYRAGFAALARHMTGRTTPCRDVPAAPRRRNAPEHA